MNEKDGWQLPNSFWMKRSIFNNRLSRALRFSFLLFLKFWFDYLNVDVIECFALQIRFSPKRVLNESKCLSDSGVFCVLLLFLFFPFVYKWNKMARKIKWHLIVFFCVDFDQIVIDLFFSHEIVIEEVLFVEVSIDLT